MNFNTKDGTVIEVYVAERDEVQIKVFDRILVLYPENAQALKLFLNTNLPEVVVNTEVNASRPAVVDGEKVTDEVTDKTTEGEEGTDGSAEGLPDAPDAANANTSDETQQGEASVQ